MFLCDACNSNFRYEYACMVGSILRRSTVLLIAFATLALLHEIHIPWRFSLLFLLKFRIICPSISTNKEQGLSSSNYWVGSNLNTQQLALKFTYFLDLLLVIFWFQVHIKNFWLAGPIKDNYIFRLDKIEFLFSFTIIMMFFFMFWGKTNFKIRRFIFPWKKKLRR